MPKEMHAWILRYTDVAILEDMLVKCIDMVVRFLCNHPDSVVHRVQGRGQQLSAKEVFKKAPLPARVCLSST